MTVQELLVPQGELAAMLQSVRDGEAVSAFGMREYDGYLVAATLGRFVFVCADLAAAGRACEQFAALGLRTEWAPSRDEVLTCAVSRSLENDLRRAAALSRFMRKDADVLVCTSSALVEPYPPHETFVQSGVRLVRGQEYDLGELVSRLVGLGYARTEQVTEAGAFSVRGDIVDVWATGEPCAYRLEFFGDTLDALHTFESFDQRAKTELREAYVAPATEIFLTEREATAVAKHLCADGCTNRLAASAGTAASMLAAGDRSARLNFLLPLCAHESFAEFFAGETVVFGEAKAIADDVTVLCREHAARFASLKREGDTFDFCKRAQYERVQTDRAAARGLLAFHAFGGQNRLFDPTKLYEFKAAVLPDYARDLPSLAADIEIWTHRGVRVTVCCGSAAARERLRDFLIEQRKGGGATLRDDFLPHGGIFFESDTVIVGTLDIGKRAAKKVIKRTGRDAFVLPEVGDYVVHRVHGIGLCENICKLDLGGAERDYIVVRYAGGDKLYLPIENIDSLSKMVASEHPKLSKIGGAEFGRLKEKVKRSVLDMALGLVELYAARAAAKGHVYSDDDSLLDAFCDDFPYSETEDQLLAVQEGLADLRQGKIMDRLLCGDVGFGKTEVAMRIAFKVICEGKQVAFVSPTTILARQHFETVRARMEKFGVRVAELTRFCSKAEIAETVRKLKTGMADIVCGTHRVFSSDVGFSDLGLLILDEEQRFGVADKEKIKKLKVNVGVLSLSATPIPRTLHMSMTGIRDISVLDTPPADRLPVQTFVTEYSEGLAVDAIRRETGRGGQVFIVYNRVADIDSFAARIASLVPECKISVAHGQLREETLGRVIEEFSEGKSDVLVASTIIENGIDMPRANTMIVIDSDRLGLSQMYQLRGRVGRSNRLAYVYFTYDPSKIMTEEAYKRLDAVTRYTELSSGFKIAMRDLEIRGAGNLLGKEQHGHIEKVGYDMYCKILQAAVDELRGQKAEEERADVAVHCDFSAFIPESYVPDKEWRIRLYARIAKLSSIAECERTLADMQDVYGPVPSPARALVRVGLYKCLAARAGAAHIYLKGGAAAVGFTSVRELPQAANAYLSSGKGVTVTQKEVRVRFTGKSAEDELMKFLTECAKK